MKDFSGEGAVVTEENLLRQRGNGRKTKWLLPAAVQSPTSVSHCLNTARSQLTWSLGNIACMRSGFLSHSSEQERVEEEIWRQTESEWTHVKGQEPLILFTFIYPRRYKYLVNIYRIATVITFLFCLLNMSFSQTVTVFCYSACLSYS